MGDSSNTVIVTFQFNAEGQSGVLSAVDAINDRIKQGQQAQAFNIANVSPGGASEPWKPSGSQVDIAALNPFNAYRPELQPKPEPQSHLPDPHEAKEFGASIETANKSLEVLVRGVESFGRILTTGRLNVAIGGFNQIGESVKGVAERFGEAGVKIGFMATAVTAAIAGFGAGAVVIKELGEHAAEAVNGFQELAAVAGLSSEKFAALQANFAQFGVGMETVQRLVRLTSVRIQEEWGSLVHAQRTAADDSVKLSLDVREATRREEEAESQARLAPFGETEAREKIKEAEAREQLAPLGVLRAEEGVEEAQTKERFAPFGTFQAQENVQEAEAKQRFAPHSRVHAEAGLEEAQLAIPKGELTTEGAKTSLLQAQLNFNKMFGTTDRPVAEKHFTPGSNEDLAYQIQRRQAEEGLKQAQLQEKSAEIRERETKGVEGGIPEAEEALRKAQNFEPQAAAHGVEEAQEGLRKAGYQERVAPLEVQEAQEGLRKARFEQDEAAPHAVAEADEGLLRAKREEAAASDEVTKAAIGVREALLALKEFPQKNAPALAEAIGKGGAGVPWAEVPASDIFRALTLRGVNPSTGVPDLQGVLKSVSGFYNLPGVPETAKAAVGAEITGGRGAGLAQVIAALTESAKNKSGIFEETDRSKGLAASMDAQKAASEEYRTIAANADIDKTKALVDVGKRTIPLAGMEEKGVAASIQMGAEAALGALDGLAASAHATVAAGEGVISTFNKIAELGARQTPEYQRALAAHPEVQGAITNEAEANKAVTNYSEQKLSSGEGSWEERFHALQTDPQYQALQTRAGQASSASETLQHNLAIQTVPSIAPKVEGLNAPIGGGGGAELKDAAEQLKEAAQALKGAAPASGGERHSTGGYINGPGTGTSDSIRAPWLSNGEYVIKADRVAEVGVDKLDALNQGRVGFADGGLVLTDDGQPWASGAQSAPADSGYWLPKVFGGIWNSLKSGATLPGDVATGKAHTTDANFASRVVDMTGFVTGGSGLGAAPEGALRMGAARAAEEKGIVAYHGSPHDFDRFDSSHIGEGEGAQAYGHGLYFAENEGVAKSYKEQLAKPKFSEDNLTDEGKASFGSKVARMVSDHEKKYGAADDGLRKVIAEKAINEMPEASFTPTGHMYQVRINAEPEHFLDWDKPLSEQHEKVQGAYNARVAPKLTTREIGNNPNIGPLTDVIHPSGGTIGTFTKDKLQDVLSNPAKYVPTRGQDFYNELEQHYGRGSLTAGKSDATDVLREAGIPGIRYLDQGSRVTRPDYRGETAFLHAANSFKDAGHSSEQTLNGLRSSYKSAGEKELKAAVDEAFDIQPPQSRNYVVFDDKLVNIENKYALGGRVGYADGGIVTDGADAVIQNETIDVPREKRTDEQIRANYRENLDVQLLSSRVGEADREDKYHKLGIIPTEQTHSQEFTPDKYGPKHWSNPVAAGEDGFLHTTAMKHNFPGYPIAEGMVQSGAGRQWIGRDGEWQEQQGGRPHPRAGVHHAKDDRYRPHDSGFALSGVSGEIKRESPEEREEAQSGSPITPYEHSAGGFKTLAEAMGVSQPRSDLTHYVERSGVPDDDRRFFGTGPSSSTPQQQEYNRLGLTTEQQERLRYIFGASPSPLTPQQQEYNRLGLTPDQQEQREHTRLGLPDDKKHEDQHISIDRQHQAEYERLGLTIEQQEKKEHERLGFALGGLFDEWRHPGRRAADTGVASYADRSQANYGVRSGIMGAFATGGLIQGPGTSTSDSISAPWVSNGEYVIKADRVAQVGVDNMHAFNEGRIGFANGGSMFADGGMIGNAGFSSGGMVGPAVASSPGFAGHYTLDVTTDKGIVPTMVNEDMMSALSQSAMGQKLIRSGINPSWSS